jgi:2-keto-4-pentenoate hydratase/2-oxohepta-3-ene-1,7-dioic acid hydratase in catechol pathway
MIKYGGRRYAVEEADVLPPTNPEKVIVLDRNQQRMIDMLGFETPEEPRFYVKTPNTVVGHEKTVTIPDVPADVVCEGELAAVIGRQCRNFSGNPENVILGYTCANDILVRDGFEEDPAAIKSNNFDSSNPIGPVVVPAERVDSKTKIELSINGEIKTQTDFSTQLFSLSRILEDITQYVTLERGDIIILGSPMDQFVLSEGDTVEVDIDGIGNLRNEITIRGLQ